MLARPHAVWKLGAIGARLFLGFVFFTGGMSKLLPFPGVMGPVWLEDALTPYGLGMYARFIAWSEAIIGVLLLAPRFAPLGAIMLVPLLLNIFVITIALHWRGTPYVVGFFLLLNAYLLAYDFHRWKLIFTDEPAPLRSWPVRRHGARADLLCVGGVLLCLVAVELQRIGLVASYASVAAGLVLLAVAGLVGRRHRPGPDPVG